MSATGADDAGVAELEAELEAELDSDVGGSGDGSVAASPVTASATAPASAASPVVARRRVIRFGFSASSGKGAPEQAGAGPKAPPKAKPAPGSAQTAQQKATAGPGRPVDKTRVIRLNFSSAATSHSTLLDRPLTASKGAKTVKAPAAAKAPPAPASITTSAPSAAAAASAQTSTLQVVSGIRFPVAGESERAKLNTNFLLRMVASAQRTNARIIKESTGVPQAQKAQLRKKSTQLISNAYVRRRKEGIAKINALATEYGIRLRVMPTDQAMPICSECGAAMTQVAAARQAKEKAARAAAAARRASAGKTGDDADAAAAAVAATAAAAAAASASRGEEVPPDPQSLYVGVLLPHGGIPPPPPGWQPSISRKAKGSTDGQGTAVAGEASKVRATKKAIVTRKLAQKEASAPTPPAPQKKGIAGMSMSMFKQALSSLKAGGSAKGALGRRPAKKRPRAAPAAPAPAPSRGKVVAATARTKATVTTAQPKVVAPTAPAKVKVVTTPAKPAAASTAGQAGAAAPAAVEESEKQVTRPAKRARVTLLGPAKGAEKKQETVQPARPPRRRRAGGLFLSALSAVAGQSGRNRRR